MLYRIFKNDWTIQLFLILPLWLYAGIMLYSSNYPIVPNYEISHLFNFISKSLTNLPILGKTLILMQIIFQSIFISLILQKHELIEKSSYLPSFIFLIFTLAFPQHLCFSPIHFSNTFLLLMLSKVLKTFEEESASNTLFSCALFAAVSILFFVPNIIFAITLIISIFVFSNVNLKSILALIFGFSFPYIYIFTYYYFTESLFNTVGVYQNSLSKGIHFVLPNHIYFQIFYFGAILIFAIIGIKLFSSSTEKLIRIRKKHQFLIIFAMFSFIGILLSNYNMTHQIGIILIGISSVTAIFLEETKKPIFFEIALWILLIFSFVLHFLQF